MIEDSDSEVLSQSQEQIACQYSVGSQSIPCSISWPNIEKGSQAHTLKQPDEQQLQQQKKCKKDPGVILDRFQIYKWEKRITLGVNGNSRVSLLDYQNEILMLFGSIRSEVDAAQVSQTKDTDLRKILVTALRSIDELATQMTLVGELDLIRTDNIRSNITGRSRKRFFNKDGSCKLACQKDLWRCFDVWYRTTGASKHTVEITIGFVPRLPSVKKVPHQKTRNIEKEQQQGTDEDVQTKKRKLGTASRSSSGQGFWEDDDNGSDDESNDEIKRAIKRRLLDLNGQYS